MNCLSDWVEHHSTISMIYGHKKPIIGSCILPDGALKTYAFVNGLPIEYRAFCVAFCLAMSPNMVNPILSPYRRPNGVSRKTPTNSTFADLTNLDVGHDAVLSEEMYTDTQKIIDGIKTIPEIYKEAFSNKHELVNTIFNTVSLMLDTVKVPSNDETFNNFCNLLHTFEEDHQNSLINPVNLAR